MKKKTKKEKILDILAVAKCQSREEEIKLHGKQLNYANIRRNKKKYSRKNKRKKDIFLGILLLLGLLSCTHRNNDKDKKIFIYNESTGISTLDPAFSSGLSVIWACRQLYNGLVELDDSLNIKPCIAKSWTISEDGKIYTFILRNDIVFHQTPHFDFKGKRYVTAQDFEYSFNRILNPETASQGAWIFRQVEHFKALNDTVFEIRLKEIFPPFLGILTMSYAVVLPQEVVELYGADYRNHPVGTGAFQFQYWKEGVKLVMRKNPDYFKTDENGNRLPYLDGVAVTFIVDKQSVFMEFMKGQIDFMSGIDAAYKDVLLDKNGDLKPEYSAHIHLEKAPYLNTEYLGFNLSDSLKNNVLKDKRIRQAINYGFSREKLIRYLRNGIGEAGTQGFVPPALLKHQLQGYDYNPEKAKQLLAEAGYPHGKNMPEIALSVSATYVDLCQFIQYELGLLGIPLKLDIQQAAQQKEMMRSYKLPFYRASWIADYPDSENYLALFYSKNLQPFGSNNTHFVNAEYDRLYEKAAQEIQDSTRKAYYVRLNAILLEEAPVCVLYYDQVVRFTRKNIKNLGINPTNQLQLEKVIKL